MADAGAGRHDAEVVERVLAPAQERVALAVALELELDVLLEGAWAVPNWSTCTEWSMTRSTGHSGLIFFGSPPSDFMRVAHRGQVDHGGHAGEVLQQHAGGAEGDLGVGLAILQPCAKRLDVVDRHRAAVFEAQQVFQQHLQRERQGGDIAEAGFSAAFRLK